jgi:uncharacterized membrane protein
MQKNEQEYITTLRIRLSGTLPQDQLDDILSDYAEHFRIGKSKGRSEEELYTSLGSPEEVAREITASYMVTKAEQTRSCGNIWHAVLATLGLGLFNLVFVLIPFIVLVVLLAVVFLVGVIFAGIGPVAFVFAILQIMGVPMFAIWFSPVAGLFFSIGILSFGLLMIIGDYYLARTFYHIGIRYLKWNIGVIRGTETVA